MVITESEQATPAWLTTVLDMAAGLHDGRVRAVTHEPIAGTTGRLARLRLRYDRGSTGPRPESLVLKYYAGRRFGPAEVYYYTRDYVDLPEAPLPRCYSAEY